MLDAAMQSQLTNYFERIVQPIELVASLDDSTASRETQELLEDLCALSPKITWTRDDGNPWKPSFAIYRDGQPNGVRFAGLPMGHEFNSLILALLHAGGHTIKESPETIAQIKALSGPLRFETFYSLSCQNCPDVVQALNLLATLHPQIDHVAIDGGLFPHDVESRGIMSVPAVFLNGALFGQGRMSMAQILAALDTDASSLAAAQIAQKEPFDVLVVGGGPAGAAAAIYAARKGIRTGVVAERFGGQVLDTMGIENFVSVSQTEGPKLVAALEQHVQDYAVDIMNLQTATRLTPGAHAGDLIEIGLASGAALKARTVILSTGARWRQMNVPGEAEYRNKGVAYCPHCDGPLFKGKRVAVVGGGNSGVEAAIDLAGLAADVTLLEYASALRADDVLQTKLRSLPNVTVITSAQTTAVHGDGARVTGLDYTNRQDGSAQHLALDGIFVQIGLVPNTEWLKDTITLTRHGEIDIDDRGLTSVPGVFAAGDATTAPYKQIIIAMGDGSKAALSAFDHLIRAEPVDIASIAAVA